jgi:hypothetical protein
MSGDDKQRRLERAEEIAADWRSNEVFLQDSVGGEVGLAQLTAAVLLVAEQLARIAEALEEPAKPENT